jgi:hypothetical protein
LSASPTLTGTVAAAAATLSGNLTLSGGLVNGITYLNGSKVLSSNSAFTFDGTNFATTGSATAKNIFLTSGTLPGVGNPSIALRSSDNIIYHQAGSANTINFLDSAQNTMQSISATANIFAISNAEGMRLTSTGLGIGTSSPDTKLAVAGGISGTGGLNISGSGWGVLPYVANSLVVDSISGETRLFATGTNSSTHGKYLFYTGTTNGTATERHRIGSNGDFYWGCTGVVPASMYFTPDANGGSFVSSGSSGSKYVFYFQHNNSTVGYISSNSGGVNFTSTSDYRLKNTIAPMTGALAKVALLKPCTYKWNYDNSNGQGFIAHELQEFFPDAVVGQKDEVDANGKIKPQGVDTSFLVATLTAAIQELKAEFDAYKASHP